MKMMMYFVTQLPGVWRTVLQISQKEKKTSKKHPGFFLHLVVKTPNSVTVYTSKWWYIKLIYTDM